MSSEALMPKNWSKPSAVGPPEKGRSYRTAPMSPFGSIASPNAGGSRRRPAQAEVPLADAGGVVAVLLEQRGDGHAAGLDQGRGVSAEHALLEPRPPGVSAGEDAVAGGRADRRAGVGVGEAHPLARRGDRCAAWGSSPPD